MHSRSLRQPLLRPALVLQTVVSLAYFALGCSGERQANEMQSGEAKPVPAAGPQDGAPPDAGQKGAGNRRKSDTYEIEVTDYKPPADPYEGLLVDDRLEDKHAVFDADLVHAEPRGEFLLNMSAAVLALDVPLVRPDQNPELLTLHASYAAAAKSVPGWAKLLPSVQMLDGKAKQFDDGLYAAIELAYYQGLESKLTGHVDVVRRLLAKVGLESSAAPFLAAALAIAGENPPEVADAATRDQLVERFLANELRSKPIGFYTWNDTLKKCFRFLRFLATEFGADELEIPAAIAAALAADEQLRADYDRVAGVYAGLTNPYVVLSMRDLVGIEPLTPAAFAQKCAEKQIARATVTLYPPSTSRETELFNRLFGNGPPPDANLMKELVTAIRGGKVDLHPRPNSGWYDRQVYALESLLLPENAAESQKLLLSKAYKRRMFDAFAALMTKRRETHARQLDMPKSEEAPARREPIEPRLRVEPCATYYLRTAQSYAFLERFLAATLDAETLASLHGQTKDGPRAPNLAVELASIRDLFYGLYAISAEDIGMRPDLAADEPVDRAKCLATATAWLADLANDPDLAADTRVSIPIFDDTVNNKTRLWATLGVRLSRLDCRFAAPPSVKPKSGNEDWQEVDSDALQESHYFVLVDEFAEVELAGLRCYDREELRKICDEQKTKENILAALRQ